MGRCSKFGPAYSYSSDTAAGRSGYFPDSLVHGAGGTLGARTFRHARVSFASFRFENTGTSNHHLPAWPDRRFFWSERVRKVRGAGGRGGTFILQRFWNISTFVSCGFLSFRSDGR